MIKKIKKPLVLAVITARGGSKGLPGKNTKILGGKPLIFYTIKIAKKSKLITDLIVSTDSSDIARIAKKYGAEVPFIRPKKLAGDKTTHTQVMRHAIAFMEKKLKVIFDYVVILQPTSPFRIPEDIDGTLKLLIETKADSAVSMVEIEAKEHPLKMKKLSGNKVEPYYMPEPEGMRRQDLPVVYKRSGAVYAMRRDLIMEEKHLFGGKVVGFVVPKERSIDIDTYFDWVKAIYILKDLKNKGYNW
jgi:CMP-N,N'-diacetyllegionaminic acid synthase